MLDALVLGPDPWYRMGVLWLVARGPLGPDLISDAGWCPCRGFGVQGAFWHVRYARSASGVTGIHDGLFMYGWWVGGSAIYILYLCS